MLTLSHILCLSFHFCVLFTFWTGVLLYGIQLRLFDYRNTPSFNKDLYLPTDLIQYLYHSSFLASNPPLLVCIQLLCTPLISYIVKHTLMQIWFKNMTSLSMPIQYFICIICINTQYFRQQYYVPITADKYLSFQ